MSDRRTEHLRGLFLSLQEGIEHLRITKDLFEHIRGLKLSIFQDAQLFFHGGETATPADLPKAGWRLKRLRQLEDFAIAFGPATVTREESAAVQDEIEHGKLRVDELLGELVVYREGYHLRFEVPEHAVAVTKTPDSDCPQTIHSARPTKSDQGVRQTSVIRTGIFENKV